MRADQILEQTSLGLDAFDSLRAEDEPWLDACFIPPRDFELMSGSRSIVVFGQRGTGKTALYRALINRCQDADGRPVRLAAEWYPVPPEIDRPVDSSSMREQVRRVFDVCAMALLLHLAYYPNAFSTAPSWTRETLAWFIHRYGQGDLLTRLGPHLEERGASGTPLLQEILEVSPPQVLSSYAAPKQVATKLTQALERIGLSGVWMMVDGLEGWAELETESLKNFLVAFLSTLPLFERASFAYKLMLPAKLEPALLHAAAVARHRVDGYRLDWEPARLQWMVERRLALATERDPFTLRDLCETPEKLLEWLKRAGGSSPREWLDQIRPLVAYYLRHRLTDSIDVETWKKLRRQHPPRIYLDEQDQQLTVGGRRVPLQELPAKGYDVLAYLYRHSDQVVSKASLYFRAYRGLDHVPRSPADDEYESPKEYRGMMDTLLWRLRQAIEPDPSDPVLLTTVRGRGLRLESRW